MEGQSAGEWEQGSIRDWEGRGLRYAGVVSNHSQECAFQGYPRVCTKDHHVPRDRPEDCAEPAQPLPRSSALSLYQELPAGKGSCLLLVLPVAPCTLVHPSQPQLLVLASKCGAQVSSGAHTL